MHVLYKEPHFIASVSFRVIFKRKKVSLENVYFSMHREFYFKKI